MKTRLTIYLLSFCMSGFFLFGSLNVMSQQSKSYLERKKDRLEKSIEYADFLIDDVHQKKSAKLQDISLLQVKIDIRRELISNYHDIQNQIFDTIFVNLIQINTINTQLQELKDEYALMINSAYQNHNFYKRLVYVLASEDINQAYSRFNYYKYYAQRRNSQIESIREIENFYFGKVEQLELKVEQNQLLIDDLNIEYALIEGEVRQMKTLIMELNERVGQLVAEQADNRKSALILEKRIEEIIGEESMNSNDLLVNQQLFNTPTPEELELSSGFKDNFGKLPWPLERGIISGYFGEQNYPDLKGVKIKNNGINILTHKGAKVRSVFQGEVTRVLAVPNYNNVVILRHGDFLSVYSNLSDVYVEKGMMVTTKQEIGMVFTDEQEAKTELHFEIWNGKQSQNPSQWIVSVQNNETHLHNKP